MMKRWPLGFHTGPDGHGVPKDYYWHLNRAGISCFAHTTDDYGKLQDAIDSWKETGTPNTLVWRSTRTDVPQYDLPPLEAAEVHLAKILSYAPPELDPDYVWVGTINEVDKNRSEWLAEFSLHLDKLAWERYRWRLVHFNWSSGEPEPHQWEGPKMLEFLRYAAANRTHTMIGLHEYSYDVQDITKDYPWLIGRWQKLQEVCTRHGIALPDFIVSELGWTLWEMPANPRTDLIFLANEYMEIPECKGGALWCLNAGWQGLHDQLIGYVDSITEMALNWPYPEDPEPPVEPPSETIDPGVVVYLMTPPLRSLTEEQWNLAGSFARQGFYPPGEQEKTNGEHPLSPSHLDAFQSVVAGQPGSRLFILWPQDIGDGITEEWLAANFPQVLPRTTLVPNPNMHMLLPPVQPDFPFEKLLLLYPLTEQGHITSRFRDPRDYDGDGIYDDEHEGLDLSTYDRTAQVVAMYPGLVIFTREGPTGYGKYVIMEHQIDGYVFRTYLAHLDSIAVEAGQALNAGSYVGEMGSTGNSTGPHLHINLQVPGYGLDGFVVEDVVNPEPFLEPFQNNPAKKPLFGLHATADPGIHPDEPRAFSEGKIEAIKVLSNINPDHLTQLVNAMPVRKTAVVRAYLSMHGRDISPQQFFQDTITDTQRTLGRLQGFENVVVELHNEPNLSLEGLGTSWNDKYQFHEWLAVVIELYRQALPGYRMIYPGLSPGPAFNDGVNFRHQMWDWLGDARYLINSVDGMGVHTYWADNYPMDLALNVVKAVAGMFPGKPLFVTEASNNKPSAHSKGHQYIDFWTKLGSIPTVTGVYYFVASASHPDFQEEIWVGTDIPSIVGTRS